jgi:hypothetical protein
MWSVVPTPYPAAATDVFLNDVACAPGSTCTAVGSYRLSPTLILTLAEHWSGGLWAIQVLPDPPGGHGSELAGIACAGRRGCTAVGYSSIGDIAASLVERFGPGAPSR